MKSIGFVTEENVREFAWISFKRGISHYNEADYQTITSLAKIHDTPYLQDMTHEEFQENHHLMLCKCLFGLTGAFVSTSRYAQFKFMGVTIEVGSSIVLMFHKDSRKGVILEFGEKQYKAYGENWDVSLRLMEGMYLDHQFTYYSEQVEPLSLFMIAFAHIEKGIDYEDIV